ncbi:type I-E CRISPR-associated protein Cse2/CasB [Nocardiopsis ansamitocini]|uniref:CRISPR system Cascade subunit CasB n=1 Tax=Nocardiopsis ansamitocini TaxID=1670832 RepID=A0A9W6P967_9ACTN|nr:type I-E CRISPR-associated protein Cse2/CasB [Nocardiopsis ansamitocini]GLU49915.1 hypothetical protein Nans01_42660 [Nocardiopsis ansamitocini]
MTDSERILARADLLVERVRALVVKEPASRAALRRGVGLTPDDPRMIPAHRIVAPFTAGERAATERAFYAVAAMMAAQSRTARDADGAAKDEPEEQAAPEQETAPTAVAEQATTAPQGPAPKRLNLGATLADAVLHGEAKADTTEQRLHLLARQPLEGVHRHLPRLVLHLRADHVALDWGLLARDLARWGRTPRQVAKEWVQTYHRALETARRTNDTTTPTDEESKAA